MTPKPVRAKPVHTHNLRVVYQTATDEERQLGQTWYQDAHSHAEAMAARHGVSTTTAIGVIAALSPGLDWDLNLSQAEEFIQAYQGGARGKWLPKVGVYGQRNRDKASKILGGSDPLDVLGGDKVRSFYQNLLDPQDHGPVTIDRHAYSALNRRKLTEKELVAIKARRYRTAERAYSIVAKQLGLVPSQFQAIIWLAWRRQFGGRQTEAESVPF
jgi:hypothetical protein